MQDFFPLRYLFDGSLNAVQHVTSEDPFFSVRKCIDLDGGELLHKWLIQPQELRALGAKSSIGFNCYLPDWMIEGHPARAEWEAEWENV